MDDAKLNRMFELIHQELVRLNAGFAELRSEMNERFAAAGSEMAALRAEMNGRFAAMRSEVNERFGTMQVETAERFQSVMDRLDLIEHKVAKGTATIEEMRQELVAVRSGVYKLDDRIDFVAERKRPGR